MQNNKTSRNNLNLLTKISDNRDMSDLEVNYTIVKHKYKKKLQFSVIIKKDLICRKETPSAI